MTHNIPAKRRAVLEEALSWAREAVTLYFEESLTDLDDEVDAENINEAITEHFRALIYEPPRRVSELLAANTREVERWREAEEEVSFWRREMLATLETAMALHSAAIAKQDEDRAADIRVNRIMPILGAFRAADAKDWFEQCECCGEFLRPEQPYALISDDPDGMTRVHATCIDAAEGFLDPIDGNAILAAACALVSCDEDTPVDASIGMAEKEP